MGKWDNRVPLFSVYLRLTSLCETLRVFREYLGFTKGGTAQPNVELRCFAQVRRKRTNKRIKSIARPPSLRAPFSGSCASLSNQPCVCISIPARLVQYQIFCAPKRSLILHCLRPMIHERCQDEIFYEYDAGLSEWRTSLNTAVGDEMFTQLTAVYKDVGITKSFFRAAMQKIFNDVWEARPPTTPHRKPTSHVLHPIVQPMPTLRPHQPMSTKHFLPTARPFTPHRPRGGSA